MESQRVQRISHFQCKLIGSRVTYSMPSYSAICVYDVFIEDRPENMASPLVSESNKLIGIASYCGDSFESDNICIYASIQKYLSWIQSILAA